jgi:AraC family transcriptional regulator
MELDEKATRPVDGPARAVHDPNAVMLARRLASECQRWNQLSPLAVESLGHELLHHALPADRSLERRAPAWLYRSIEQLHTDHAGCVSIGDLAQEAGVHPVYLARAFRRFVGCGPAELQRTLRVKRALELIRATPQSFSSISASCGFADQSHMNRAVRALTGSTPSELRGGRPATTA